ncbi:KIF-binding protein isoform X1 [Trachemys scripta elegans]|uniref:KIF-binding protein isoform X1 n=1 Tax=Trachemys scripta elegans TaxID=31138 RepID=UPI001557A929|nr:KIF-binding protein isoform X1 [Trachemys scripta elegans]
MAAPAGWASLCEKFRSSLSLSNVESKKDPENEPYRSKYGARELLEEIRQLLGSEEAAEAEGAPAVEAAALRAVRLAVVEYELGVNHTETEELSAGEEHLLKCTRLLERHRLSRDCVSLYIQAQNNLGILWSERGEIKTAQTYLESAEALYNQYMKENGNPPLDPNEHFMAEEEKLTDQERSKRFEKAYTHTLYYLAQVYQHLEMIEKAAQYCHTTLKRQLEYSGYYPVEWALNAATLSQYYLTKQCFMESRHCLAAANVIFSQAGQVPSSEDNMCFLSDETEQDQQDLRQRKAEIARCWIKYCLTLLQSARKSLEDNIGELDPDRQSELKAQRKKEEDEKEKGRKKAVLFGTSDLCDSILATEEKVSCICPLDFQEAREVFLVGQNYVHEAKEFFQFDGYVTDHIEIVQDHSALFKVLAFFEEDYERRCKMHKRRIDMLEPMYVDLNPQYYLLISRQLQFELADTYYEMMDLKVAIGNRLEELDSHTIKKINSLAQLAVKYYELFLDSLRNPDKIFPEKLEDDVLRPAMVAKFHIARLYGKLITSDGKKQLENMQTSLEYYTFLVDYCEKHPEAVQAIETELELSKEMVGLLPTRMERLKAKLSPFS